MGLEVLKQFSYQLMLRLSVIYLMNLICFSNQLYYLLLLLFHFVVNWLKCYLCQGLKNSCIIMNKMSVRMKSDIVIHVFCTVVVLSVYPAPPRCRYIPHFSGLFPMPFRLEKSNIRLLCLNYLGMKYRHSTKNVLLIFVPHDRIVSYTRDINLIRSFW